MQLIIENNRQEIIKTNFWETDMAKKGGLFLSSNAGAFRLLVPFQHFREVAEFKSAKDVILTRGFWPESGGEGMEILFDDESDSPYSIHLSHAQLDRWPSKSDIGKEFTFTVWIFKTPAHTPFCAYKSKCLFRITKKLPYLKPR
jgi:hypothetical protein